MMIVGACAYAVILGGWEGRWTAGIFVGASLLSLVALKLVHIHWHKTNMTMLGVDMATLIALYVVAAKSRHWWPVWVVAFQLNAVASHLAALISQDFSVSVYRNYTGLWAVPCALVMIIGIFRDRFWKVRNDYA
jgi:hypothetical protein